MTVDEDTKNQRKLFSAIKRMHEAIDETISTFEAIAQQQNSPIDCKKGCEWCCHQPVFALDYELEYLNDFIREYLSEDQIKEIALKAHAKRKNFEGLTKEQLLNAKFPCPILHEGACIAYYARPMACRIYLSSNVLSCYKFYQTPDDASNFPGLLEFPMRLGRMMNEGFKAALKTKGIYSEEFRIEEKF